MKLIEKKCPNCGATLEFAENDKSCKCTYCKRGFEIERDTDNLDKFNLIYDKMQKPVKTFMMMPFIFAGIVFLIIIVSFLSFSGHIRSHTERLDESSISEDFDDIDKNEVMETVESLINNENSLISDAANLTNDDLESLDHKCFSIIHQSVTGRSDTTYSYHITGDPRVQKVYVAYKEESNRIISIYEVIYHNTFNQSDQQTVYVPVVFEDVKRSVSVSLSNGKNPAPKYYLNSEKSSYIYAYGSFDEAYNDVVKSLEGEYTISEK